MLELSNKNCTRQNIWNIIVVLNWLVFVNIASSNDEVANHIRNCCRSGIQYAVNYRICEKYDHDISRILPLWHGLCHSTYSVCCSKSLEDQYCTAGRQAALQSLKCDDFRNIPPYVNCCFACKLGLAIKTSNIDCRNSLFSYFNEIKSYLICCEESTKNNIPGSTKTLASDAIQMNVTANDESRIYMNTTGVEIGSRVQRLFANANDGVTIVSKNEDVETHFVHIHGQDVEVNDNYEDDNKNTQLEKNENTFQCSSGYSFDKMQEKCADIDECSLQLDSCKSRQYCHNTIGSYHCLNVNLHQCDPKSKECYNQCKTGLQYINESCVDIDECAVDIYACDSTQVCTNDIGGYRCDCKIGFNLDITTNACVDINECSINNHNCLPTQRCDNTYGSYICIRLQSCGTGYTLNAETGNCDDDDECTLSTHNCPNDYECYNTKGSFRCYRRITSTSKSTAPQQISAHVIESTPITPPSSLSTYMDSNQMTVANTFTYTQKTTPARIDENLLLPCSIGFHRNKMGACVDLNECILTNPCGSHQRCVNTNGSYRCTIVLQCSQGYMSTPDNMQCVDIDECETGEHQCIHNQICTNRKGGYICSCPPGHQLSHSAYNNKHCVDINECLQQIHPTVCPSNSQCINTVGAYYCDCKTGFKKSMNNDNICLDVDECKDISGLCQQKCINFWGGYRCTCNKGYELSEDNRTCNDINECEVHKTYKQCMGYCNNIPGSYQCFCPRGYTLDLDKNTCRDIDECATGEFCTGSNDVCTNIPGSYKCLAINCQHGYINDPDQKNRCRLISNLCEGENCYSKPFAYTYNFITLISKLVIPPEGRIIFSLRGPLWYDGIDFDWKILKIQAAANVKEASNNYFDIIKENHEAHLQLKHSLEGPQDIELELSMTVFTSGMPRGKSIAKIFILVSQYTF